MKMLVAFVQPQQLPTVKQTLFNIQVRHITCSNSLGTAPDGTELEKFRGVAYQTPMFQKVRLEIALHDDMVEPVIDAITQGAEESGGYAMVYVMELVQVVNVGTGKRGDEAIL